MTQFAVVEIDDEFGINTATIWPDKPAAEGYQGDLLAAYEYSDGVNITVIEIQEPLDRTGLQQIAALKDNTEVAA